MGVTRSEEPPGNAQGQAVAHQEGEASQGGASRKRTARALSVDGAAAGSMEGGSSGQEESGSTLAPVTMVECTRVGPSEDTLQLVLPLLLERVEPEGAVQMFQVCTTWRGELESRGFCGTTAQLCSSLAKGGDAARLREKALRLHQLHQHILPLAFRTNTGWDASEFLLQFVGWGRGGGEQPRGLHQWLQAASQEPDASFLSRGAATTAACLALPLVHWFGKPRERDPACLAGHSESVGAVACSPDGTRVVSGSEDTLVKIWNAQTGAEVCTLAGHSGQVYSVDFSPDGKHVVSESDEDLKIWDVETGTEVRTVTGHWGEVTRVSISPDGKCIISESRDNLVKIWDFQTGAEMFTLKGHSGGSLDIIRFSRDGKRVIFSDDDLVKIWDTETRSEVCTMADQLGGIFCHDFSPDGKLVCIGSRDNLVRIWDATTGALVHSLGHNCSGSCICDLEAEEDNVDVDPGCPVIGHAGADFQAEFSDDGTQIISSGGDDVDKTVRFWDVASGLHVRQLAGSMFALVEGLSDAHKRGRHVITARDDMLLLYAAKEPPHVEGRGQRLLWRALRRRRPFASCGATAMWCAWGVTEGRCVFCRRRSSLPDSGGVKAAVWMNIKGCHTLHGGGTWDLKQYSVARSWRLFSRLACACLCATFLACRRFSKVRLSVPTSKIRHAVSSKLAPAGGRHQG